MKKPLSHFRYGERETIAKLEGMKSIMEVKTKRQYSWWLVLPAVGEKDSVCVLIEKMQRSKGNIWGTRDKVLANYFARTIIS